MTGTKVPAHKYTSTNTDTEAAVFAGNAIVIKTSEYASWSTKFYGRMIKACLAAAGAPQDFADVC